MSERLGLFTIIIFGEVVLGVVNGTIALHDLSLNVWLNFALAVFIVFALWWIFFTLISDRKCKIGFVNSSLLEILYIPTLMALGLIGIAFSGLFESFSHVNLRSSELIKTFGFSLSLFLLGISAMLFFLEYPSEFNGLKKRIQQILWGAVIIFLMLTQLNLQWSLFLYLLIVLMVLLSIIFILNQSWYTIKFSNDRQAEG